MSDYVYWNSTTQQWTVGSLQVNLGGGALAGGTNAIAIGADGKHRVEWLPVSTVSRRLSIMFPPLRRLFILFIYLFTCSYLPTPQMNSECPWIRGRHGGGLASLRVGKLFYSDGV